MMSVAGIEKVIPARSGRLQVLRIVNDLTRQPARATHETTDLAVLLQGGFHSIHRRSLVVIVSDFISAPGWEKPLSLLNQRHEVVAICIRDPREVELPDVGAMILQDSETGQQMYVDTHDGQLRARFHAAAQQREDALRTAFHRAGVDSLWLSTDEDLVRAFVRFAALRQRRRRSA
jgi:uncharacterized protein (DUF58 family)